MRVSPISRNNSQQNVQFKKLQIYKPNEWDVDVLEAVTKNESIREWTKYLADKGKDLLLSLTMKPAPFLQARVDDKWRNIIMPQSLRYYTKEAMLEQLSKFDYKVIIREELEQEELEKKAARERNRILEELDEFNKEIAPAEEKNEAPAKAQTGSQSQKRSFWKRLLGMKQEQ